ncbi:fimbrial protein [Proteus columbae]|uniref:fimbrial protein n=1 Tax=Proteus columbae TaxID=1987580 RepID=UPI0018C5FEAE|nr:fimbrial protein [Proteus columbae]MBG6026282.1 type 1 fimbrial protein [Proteus mirabilis]MBG6047146.1 type 1 fimbrial protein [Proteus mirabilis]
MNKSMLSGCIIGSCLLFSSSVFAAENLNIFGSLIIAPCKVLPEHSQVDVVFDEIRLDDIYKSYFEFEKKDFKIILSECDISIAKQVKIKFEGATHNELAGLLALDDSANNPDLGIKITTKEGIPIKLGDYTGLYNIPNNGIFELNFIAYLQATAKAIADKSIKPGHFSATAVFSLKYE